MKVTRVLETCLYVDDLEASERFYHEVLGLQVHSRKEQKHVFLRCGNQMLLLFNPDSSTDPERSVPSHGGVGAGHIAFAVPAGELTQWEERLVEMGTSIEREMTWPSGGRSIYFRDPAGNSVEIATPLIWNIDEGEIFIP